MVPLQDVEDLKDDQEEEEKKTEEKKLYEIDVYRTGKKRLGQ